MSWVTDRFDNDERAQKDAAHIRAHSADLYEEIWREIAERVAEAKANGMAVTTNGSAYKRVVLRGGTHGNFGPFRPASQLRVSLSDDKLSIIVQVIEAGEDESGDPLQMPIGICEDGVLCLKQNKRKLPIPEAAKLILEPFLFPSAGALT